MLALQAPPASAGTATLLKWKNPHNSLNQGCYLKLDDVFGCTGESNNLCETWFGGLDCSKCGLKNPQEAGICYVDSDGIDGNAPRVYLDASKGLFEFSNTEPDERSSCTVGKSEEGAWCEVQHWVPEEITSSNIEAQYFKA